jgi:hypothetical protein
MKWEWKRTVGAREFTFTPAPGHQYTCVRVSDRSKKYFAQHNGTSLPSRKTRVFWGPIDKCMSECERHYENLMEKEREQQESGTADGQ